MTLSQRIHWLLFGDDSTSLCGRAWAYRDHPGWALFVRAADAVLGPGHCAESADWHQRRRAEP